MNFNPMIFGSMIFGSMIIGSKSGVGESVEQLFQSCRVGGFQWQKQRTRSEKEDR